MSDERNDDAKLGWGCQSKMEVSKDTEQKKNRAKDIFNFNFFFSILSPKKPCPNFYNRPLKINLFRIFFIRDFTFFKWGCHMELFPICLLLNTPAQVGTTLRCRRNSVRVGGSLWFYGTAVLNV